VRVFFGGVGGVGIRMLPLDKKGRGEPSTEGKSKRSAPRNRLGGSSRFGIFLSEENAVPCRSDERKRT